MSFFDDKQEILKVELTTYGRFLLSRGKWKPVYYAFFDDDIIYDGDHADLGEDQNDIQVRILDESLSMKPQTTYTSVENSVKKSSISLTEQKEEPQVSSDKNYALCLPLANSSLSSDYAPAWAINLLKGKISSSATSINNSDGQYDIVSPFLSYPQINLADTTSDIIRKTNDDTLVDGYKAISVITENDNTYTYSMKDEPIIIDVRENNVDDLLKNFDIELFIEEDERILGSTSTKKVLRKLDFKRDTIFIENGILLDEPKTFDVAEDNSFAEYYFEITIDDEIELPPQQVLETGGVTYGPSGLPRGPYGADC